MFRTTAAAAILAVALSGGAFAQGNSGTKNNVDAGGGKGLVVVHINLANNEVTALNDLINDTNIAVPAQVTVPLTVAANICGVAVNVIASDNDRGDKTCEATSASQALADAVVQQAQ